MDANSTLGVYSNKYGISLALGKSNMTSLNYLLTIVKNRIIQLSPNPCTSKVLYDSLFLLLFLPQNIYFWLPGTGIIQNVKASLRVTFNFYRNLLES